MTTKYKKSEKYGSHFKQLLSLKFLHDRFKSLQTEGIFAKNDLRKILLIH